MLRASGAATTADIAVDLGTSHTRIVTRAEGLVADVPTVVATGTGARGRELVAVGEEARRMIGRTHTGLRVVQPVRGGVVADFEATEQLLRHLLRRTVGRSLRRPRLAVCVPTGTTEVERRAVQESARAAGARDVVLLPMTLAAALGAGLPVSEPVGGMIIDVGGGRTDVGVVSLGGVVVRRSIPVAGDALDEAIVAWARAHHSLLLAERTAINLKHHVGGASADLPHKQMRVRGRDLVTSTPRELDISTADVAQALAEPLRRIRAAVAEVLGETSPELSADIVERGILTCGGTSDLRGLDAVLRDDTSLPVLQTEAPRTCVARGASSLLDDPALFDRAAHSL